MDGGRGMRLDLYNSNILHLCQKSEQNEIYDFSKSSGEHGHVSVGNVLSNVIRRDQHFRELSPAHCSSVAAGPHLRPLFGEPLHIHHCSHGCNPAKGIAVV